jgi:FKBP-type peptidyl-prolyl cis-trans isomerase FkpA
MMAECLPCRPPAEGSAAIMSRSLLLVSLIVLASAACSGGGSPSAPTPVTGSAPFSTTDLRAGTGAEAQPGQRITVNYAGWLYSNTAAENKGAQFDSGRGVSFTLGTLIAGWNQGIPGMRVGGLRRLVIPPELAYGATGNGPIPPNATLLFEVELVSIP